jgi:hypothetical protein
MRGLPLRLAVIVLVAACSVPAYGHHSFAAVYVESESVTLEGDVVEFMYGAPHAWLYVRAADAQGVLQRYGAEWANPSRLERAGVDKQTFQPGDRVTMTGAPARDESTRHIHLKRVTRLSRGEWKWPQPPPQRRR